MKKIIESLAKKAAERFINSPAGQRLAESILSSHSNDEAEAEAKRFSSLLIISKQMKTEPDINGRTRRYILVLDR